MTMYCDGDNDRAEMRARWEDRRRQLADVHGLRQAAADLQREVECALRGRVRDCIGLYWRARVG